MFIVFEGLDGSGSSTQAELLNKTLQTENYAVILTKEPTTNPIGKLIRRYLKKKIETSPKALQLLFAADREDHLDYLVIPSLLEKKIVISDRYYFSSIAFGALAINFEWLDEFYANWLKPDLVFLLKVPPAKCIKRIEQRGNGKELFEQISILEKVWKNYERLANKYNFIHIIDGTQSIIEIQTQVSQIVFKNF